MRFINKLKIDLYHNPQRPIGWLIVFVFGCLIAVPLLQMVLNTFIVQERDATRVGAEAGALPLFTENVC